jgi:hypothetical protein
VPGIQKAPHALSPEAQDVAFPVARVRRVCSDQADARSGRAAKKRKERMMISRGKVVEFLARFVASGEVFADQKANVYCQGRL